MEWRESYLEGEAWGQLVHGLVCQDKEHKILNVGPNTEFFKKIF